ncbi:hypothetical protein NDU88_012142 [Pleurodeles waltl]|uniref:Uncharacterized protein n=1 Tax=Pleurodeles waltl TaxID=8319 RepID=A0AAV7QZB8_PLEWA|nr:hypothetical protein NDU88_012142 [Pleurodeles waltl]
MLGNAPAQASHNHRGLQKDRFTGKMGKRKAVDFLDPPSDRKKLKERPPKLATKTKGNTHKPFEEIDQLFEEVEAILNCTVGNKGPPSLRKSLQGSKTFLKKERMTKCQPPFWSIAERFHQQTITLLPPLTKAY